VLPTLDGPSDQRCSIHPRDRMMVECWDVGSPLTVLTFKIKHSATHTQTGSYHTIVQIRVSSLIFPGFKHDMHQLTLSNPTIYIRCRQQSSTRCAQRKISYLLTAISACSETTQQSGGLSRGSATDGNGEEGFTLPSMEAIKYLGQISCHELPRPGAPVLYSPRRR